MKRTKEHWLGAYSEPWGKLEMESDRSHWGLGVSVRHGRLGSRVGDSRQRSFWTAALRVGPYTFKATKLVIA